MEKNIIKALDQGPVVCAEGYLFELERRGYLKAGPFVPEVVLEYPEVVEQLHREFVRCGSDVVEAFTYYAHREKLKVINKEDQLESMNRNALQMAKKIADEKNLYMAGNICNTNIYVPNDPKQANLVRNIFKEQVTWAKEEGADFIIAETINFLGEAIIALEEITKTGLKAVINLAIGRAHTTWDGYTPHDACAELEKRGASVVGLNCYRGPDTMLPMIQKIRDTVKCHVAALPVPYRTTQEQPIFQCLCSEHQECQNVDKKAFPVNLDPFLCSRQELAVFARKAYDLGVHFIGVCCGAGPHHIRSVAEALGKTTEASKYSPDMSRHYAFGDNPKLYEKYKQYIDDLICGDNKK